MDQVITFAIATIVLVGVFGAGAIIISIISAFKLNRADPLDIDDDIYGDGGGL